MPDAGSLALRGLLVPEMIATAWAGVGVPAGPDPIELDTARSAQPLHGCRPGPADFGRARFGQNNIAAYAGASPD